MHVKAERVFLELFCVEPPQSGCLDVFSVFFFRCHLSSCPLGTHSSASRRSLFDMTPLFACQIILSSPLCSNSWFNSTHSVILKIASPFACMYV